MFFAKPDVYPASGLYNLNHLLVFIILSILIVISVKMTKIKNKKDITNIIRILTIIVWILEIIKIIFNFKIGNISNVNTYVPLYFCSLLLYAGIFSGFCKGVLQEYLVVFVKVF